MAIQGIDQPDYIQISDDLRLRRYDGTADFVFSWYQDPELVYLVDGVRKPYDRETLYNMYNYLAARGELYFIEARGGTVTRPSGTWPFPRPICPSSSAYRNTEAGAWGGR